LASDFVPFSVRLVLRQPKSTIEFESVASKTIRQQISPWPSSAAIAVFTVMYSMSSRKRGKQAEQR